jgi:hypothetical protein
MIILKKYIMCAWKVCSVFDNFFTTAKFETTPLKQKEGVLQFSKAHVAKNKGLSTLSRTHSSVNEELLPNRALCAK